MGRALQGVTEYGDPPSPNQVNEVTPVEETTTTDNNEGVNTAGVDQADFNISNVNSTNSNNTKSSTLVTPISTNSSTVVARNT
jgi:hypothetical protein